VLVIGSFGDKATSDVYHGINSREARGLGAALRAGALRKLDMINSANNPKDLQAPPGNRLERLKGKLAGFWSIRINDQFRIIFRFEGAVASDVRIIDYH
jgi:proteic killer suppression protein